MAQGNAHLQEVQARQEQSRLSKEQLLRPRLVREEVPIPQLDGTVVLQTLSHAKRMEINQKANVGKDNFDEDLLTMLSIVESVVEPDLTLDDVEELRKQDYAIIDALSNQIAYLNMFGKAEELKKESSTTETSDSPLS